MPDRYGEHDDSPADDPVTAAFARMAPLGTDEAIRSAEHIAAQAARDRCTLCDDDGYRGSIICDHQDHRPAYKRGMTKLRQTMGWN
jgi:hypothetical protein